MTDIDFTVRFDDLYSRCEGKAPPISQIIIFLNEQMPKLLTKEKAAKLELEINSEEKHITAKARKTVQKLLENLIMKKADILNLMSIKLHADLYLPRSKPETNPFITFKDGDFGFEFVQAKTPDAYRKAILEVSKKEYLYFMHAYTYALSLSDIKSSSSGSSYETPLRKLRFINGKINALDRANDLNKILRGVMRLLHRTSISYAPVMLSIIDLHYKITAKNHEKTQIDEAIQCWTKTLQWDAEHLKRHTGKPREFFSIADFVMRDKLKLQSYGMSKITSIQDIAQALDQHTHYKYDPIRRKKTLDFPLRHTSCPLD